MKKVICLCLIISLSLAMLFSLTSCGSKSDVPENMQLVAGGENLGYYFYGPEGWVIANQGDVNCTYVSSIDYSSITFAPLEDGIFKGDETTAVAVGNYFKTDSEKFGREPFTDYTLTKNGESCTFGNADEAYKFIYSYTYSDKPYTCMQIIVFKGEDAYIFTYNASSQNYREDKSFYQFYLTDYVQKAIDSFKFTDKKPKDDEKPEYERDSVGDMLVSKKNECGFTMWVGDDWTVDYSTAIVSVSREDGSNINVCELLNSAISIKDNYLLRKEKLSRLADKVVNENGEEVSSFTEIKGVSKDENGNESLSIIELENARSAAEFEYTYTLFGKTYHVYQVFIVNGHLNMKAYVYTFTAEESCYNENIEEAKAILHKIGY